MQQQPIPNTTALKCRVTKLTWAQRDQLAVLGMQRVYEMGMTAGYADLNSYVRRRIAKLSATTTTTAI